MNNIFRSILFSVLFVNTANSYASLIGDSITIDRRYEDIILSSRTITVDSGIELFNWQNIYFDFFDYGIDMIPDSSIGYFGSGFNGFDFYELNFAQENEIISSVNAYYFDSFYGTVLSDLDPDRLIFSDHSLSLNLAGTGFGSFPLRIEISTTISSVPIPSALLLFSTGLLGLIGISRQFNRE